MKSEVNEEIGGRGGERGGVFGTLALVSGRELSDQLL